MPREKIEALSCSSLVTRAACSTDDQGLAVQVGAAYPGPGDVRGPGLAIIAPGEAPGTEQETHAGQARARGNADRGAELAVTAVELNQTGNKLTTFFSLIPEISFFFSPTLSQHSARV